MGSVVVYVGVVKFSTSHLLLVWLTATARETHPDDRFHTILAHPFSGSTSEELGCSSKWLPNSHACNHHPEGFILSIRAQG